MYLSYRPLEDTLSYLLGVENLPSHQLRSKRTTSNISSSDISNKSNSGFNQDNSNSFLSSSQSAVTDACSTNAFSSSLSSSSSSSMLISAIARTPRLVYLAVMSLFTKTQPFAHAPPKTKTWIRQILKIVTGLLLLAIAIFIPSFDRILGESKRNQ